jgi:hypothetical protein
MHPGLRFRIFGPDATTADNGKPYGAQACVILPLPQRKIFIMLHSRRPPPLTAKDLVSCIP